MITVSAQGWCARRGWLRAGNLAGAGVPCAERDAALPGGTRVTKDLAASVRARLLNIAVAAAGDMRGVLRPTLTLCATLKPDSQL